MSYDLTNTQEGTVILQSDEGSLIHLVRNVANPFIESTRTPFSYAVRVILTDAILAMRENPRAGDAIITLNHFQALALGFRI